MQICLLIKYYSWISLYEEIKGVSKQVVAKFVTSLGSVKVNWSKVRSTDEKLKQYIKS